MDCQKLAAGVVAAVQSEAIQVPLIVRMEGTHVQEGKQIFQDSQIKITLVETLAQGATEAVALAGQGGV